ncbi:MAG: bifunctional proline dehydrogenase/L-glutamate gamma-semialdehyde dehydrogenase PutA [Parasphingorhabdus sp.]|uniref:bifunctional proline dehydrogenase/L-glutamate gamma-semialdehyde dehydrogenase PutA n=1 Tax=Parasphingorhabdus sp. TaxID=2709688 RepID=UPI00326791EC
MTYVTNLPLGETALRDKVAAATLQCENEVFLNLSAELHFDDNQWQKIVQNSGKIIETLRSEKQPALIDQFLTEYGLSTDEGIQLMRLAEALSRTTDPVTADQLIKDKLMQRDWLSHSGPGHRLAMSLSGRTLHLVDRWLCATDQARNPIVSAGNAVLRFATKIAIRMLSSQFVFAETLDQALKRADKYRKRGYLFSFDMLGEGARTAADAACYYHAYSDALNRIAAHAQTDDPRKNNGISIKLSALHPRYEYAQSETAIPEIVDLLVPLAIKAKAANVQITIDAEEAERLDISMDVLAALIAKPELEGWHGLGFVVQAYQRRALPLLDWLDLQAQKLGAPLMIRLVKGAYWDSEIKRAQEMGLSSYPVFTRKEMTDLSYLACAARLLSKPDSFSPQFATHNANSIAAIQELAGPREDFEFQRLFGMGQQLHDMILGQGTVQSRIYAPVGTQKDLLSYLIRRLLENGANSSFVHKLVDPDSNIDSLTIPPSQLIMGHEHKPNENIPSPRSYLTDGRLTAIGWDLSNPLDRQRFQREVTEARTGTYEAFPIVDGKKCVAETSAVRNPARLKEVVGQSASATKDQAIAAVTKAHSAIENWQSKSPDNRARILDRAAELLETRAGIFHYLAIHEAGKSWSDAIDEVREAIDFCRYYAGQIREDRFRERRALGVVVCISPWNFPLAIFLGQITAALAAGNTVVAKPAEQTPLIATEAIRLLHEAGVDSAALQFIPGDGAEIGEALVSHPSTAGVCFTGSTAIAKRIASVLADTGRPLTPLIAETGGINAMIVDSSALLEQTIDAVISSAFQSAGQRCSALRILCVQDDIAEDFLQLLAGAMDALRVGDTSTLDIDIGPVIDATAQANIKEHMARLDQCARVIRQAPAGKLEEGYFIRPAAYELEDISDLDKEVFGPVLHVVRFNARDKMNLIGKINQRGYGLTLGIQSRIDFVSDTMARDANVGNIYVNRNQIGAVVGVQPFGGHGMSGTGPKAGGPLYLHRLSRPADVPVVTGQTIVSLKSDEDPQSLAALCAHLEQSKEKQSIWSNRTDKTDILLSAADPADPTLNERLQLAIAQCEKMLPHEGELASPAGETNVYQHSGRGVILSLLPDITQAVDGCFRSLLTGNTFVQISTDHIIDPLALLAVNLADLSGCAKLVGQFTADENNIDRLIKLGSFDALLVSPEDPSIGVWGSILARRTGPIIPILVPDDLADRYVHEKTTTRNIAAAGGDVSLLNA